MGNDVFHQHLDVCKQCRERPFELCPTGAMALREAVTRPCIAPSGQHCRCPTCCDCGAARKEPTP